MTRKIIRIGTSPNDGTGDSLRETANKINFNFAELYTALGLDGCGSYSLNIAPPCGSDIKLTTCGLGKIVLDSSTTIELKTASSYNVVVNAGGELVSTSPLRLSGDPTVVGIYFADGTFQSTAGGGGGSSYTLPTASNTVKGGVKIGSGLAVDGNGVLSVQTVYNLPAARTDLLGGVKIGTGLYVSSDGVLSVIDSGNFSLTDGAAGTFLRTNGSGAYTFQALPVATGSTLGVIKVGANLTISNDGTLNAVPASYNLPTATSATLGGIRVGANLTISNGILSAQAVPTSLTDLGIADGTANQYLRTDGSGNFFFDDIEYPDIKLDDCTDVFFQSIPTTNQVLKFDGIQWVNGDAPAGVVALNDLTDVTLGTLATGDVLKYNGSAWVNGAAAPANPFDQDLNTTNQVRFSTTTANSFNLSGSGTPTVSSDTDLYLEAIGGKVAIVSKSPFKLATFTTTERNALTGANGDMIYNSTVSKFQGFANGVWVDLH